VTAPSFSIAGGFGAIGGGPVSGGGIAPGQAGQSPNLNQAVRALFRSGQVATVGAGLQTLGQFNVPAGLLAPNGQTIRVECAGHTGADGGTLNILYGGTIIANVAVAGAASFQITIYIVRESPGHQAVNTMSLVAGINPAGAEAELAKDETQVQPILFRASTAVATPVVLDQCLIELLGS